ncbi:MAG TPA: HlyC/CorC family transporter, partial [Balneola sp.]|nr:HlyC/CorC family transporter [Balneola sp.]
TKNPDTFLTTTLVGNNIVNVVYATLMALFLVEPIMHYTELWFGVEPSSFQILAIQTFIASLIIMLFGE